MEDYFSSFPFLLVSGTLFCLICVYLAVLFSKYVPHLLLSVYSTLTFFYALTNIKDLPLTTIFVMLFGPIILLKTSFRAVRSLWPIALYLGVVILSCGLNGIGLWENKSMFIAIVITCLCCLSLVEDESEQRLALFVDVLIVWATLNSVFSVLQIAKGGAYYFLSAGQAYEVSNITRGYGMIGMATSLGIVYCVAIPFLVARALTSTKHRSIFLFLLLINMIGLIISFSRGAILGVYVSTFVVLFFSRKKKWLSIYAAATLFFVLSYSAITLLFPDQYSTFFQGGDLSARVRPLLVQIGIEMFRDRPILGFGLGGYMDNVMGYGYLMALEAHNTFIQILVEYGIVGLSTFFLVIFRSIKGYVSYVRHGESEVLRTLSIGGIASMVAVLVDSYFHAFEWRLELWLPITIGFLMELQGYKECVLIKPQHDNVVTSVLGM